jgi:hypothetical protein
MCPGAVDESWGHGLRVGTSFDVVLTGLPFFAPMLDERRGCTQQRNCLARTRG